MDIFKNNNLTELAERLGKTKILLIWVGLIAILNVIEGVVNLWTKQSNNLPLLAIAFVHSIISNPLLVGFTYTFINGKKQKLTIRDGAFRGAFAVLAVTGAEIIMSKIVFPDASLLLGGIWGIIFFIFIPIVWGAIAGIVATLWRNKDQEKITKEETENSDSENAENEQNKKLDLIGLEENGRVNIPLGMDKNLMAGKAQNTRLSPHSVSGENKQNEKLGIAWLEKSDVNDILFYLAYFFILLGAAATLGIMIFNGYWEVLITPFVFSLLGPSINALIVNTLLWKFYHNRLSGVAVLLASLVFVFSSVWIMLSIMPLLKQMWGLLHLGSLFWVCGWHILTLIVVFALGWTIKKGKVILSSAGKL